MPLITWVGMNCYIGNAVTLHAFHGFSYVIDVYTITLFQLLRIILLVQAR